MTKWTAAQRNKRLFWYVAFLFVLTVFLRLVLIDTYKADYGGSDQNVIYGIQRILLSEPLYQDPSQPAYAIIQYTPLHYYLAAGTARLFHIDGRNVEGVFAVSRTLNLLFNLLTILIVAGMIRTWSSARDKIWTYALPAIIILTTHYYVRIDSLEILFFTAAMATYLRYLQRGGTGLVWRAALLCGACVMSKQNGVLSIGIIGFSLLFQQRKLFLAIGFGVLSILAAGVIAWLCNGNHWLAFYQNPYLGLKNGMDFSWLYTIFISQFYYDLILCYFVSAVLAFYAFRATKDKAYQFIATGAVLSFLFALVSGLKIGSSNNYFTEMLLFVLVGLPLFLESDYSDRTLFRLGRKRVSLRLFAGIAFFVLITSKTMGFFTSIYIEKRLVSDKAEYEREAGLYRYFKETLQLKQGEHVYFTNRAWLDNFFIGYSLFPCKDVIYQTYVSSPNTFDYSGFIQGMNTGLVKYVVTGPEDTSMNMRQTTEMPFVHFEESKFHKLATVNSYTIYQYSGQ